MFDYIRCYCPFELNKFNYVCAHHSIAELFSYDCAHYVCAHHSITELLSYVCAHYVCAYHSIAELFSFDCAYYVCAHYVCVFHEHIYMVALGGVLVLNLCYCVYQRKTKKVTPPPVTAWKVPSQQRIERKRSSEYRFTYVL